jgi:peptide/nickel transport system permease protein
VPDSSVETLVAEAAPPAADPTAVAPQSEPSARMEGLVEKGRFGVGFWLAVAWMALVVFAAIFANLLPLDNPNASLVGPPNQGPTWHHLFGTDYIGHDIFSQVVFGARTSMIIGASSVVVGIGVGSTLGVLAGFYRKGIDVAVVWITDVLLTLPGLILALTLVAFLGESLQNVIIAIDVLSIPAYARITRGATLAVSQREWVTSALALGARPRRVLFREVVPMVALPIASYAAIGASIAILAQGGLAFLGLSPPNNFSWGTMLAEGQQQLITAPQLTFSTMIVFFLTILALNFIGQKATGTLDLRQAQL